MTGKLRVTLAFWWSLLGVWLLANQLRAQQPPARLAQPWEAIGFGSDAEKAKEDALKQAARQLGTLVEQRYPALANWQPSPRYVEENCVEKIAMNEEELLPNNPKVKGFKLTLTLKPPDFDSLSNIARRDLRKLRGDQRLRWSMWALPFLVFGIAVFVTYVRFERHTAGRYTLWLRAAALTTAATAGVAWWWAKDLFLTSGWSA